MCSQVTQKFLEQKLQKERLQLKSLLGQVGDKRC